MAGCDALPNSPLRAALNQLCSSGSIRLRLESPVPVAVLTVERYLADGRVAGSSGYGYDVTVADGGCRVKCRLAPGLSRLVQVNALRCGVDCGVVVTQLALVYDERRLGPCCICLEDVRCGEGEDVGEVEIMDVESLCWFSRDDGAVFSVLSHSDVPLNAGRKHYLALWNNEDPYGTVWVPNAPPPDVAIDASKVCLLSDLDSRPQTLPLLVRVLHRSRLRYYGKPGQYVNFPFQAYFEVADQSGVMSLVLWNDLCAEWYSRLTVGSVLFLQQYSLKPSYQKRSRPQLSHLPLLTLHSTEISLNPQKAVITVVPPKSVQPQWCLPDVPYNFLTRSEVDSLATNQACDVIALVTFVGRVERIRNKGTTATDKLWTYRWVHAVDGSSDAPFILEIFACSQPEIFSNISPMTYLVCTQMRVRREPGASLHLTSSTETQLYITGCHKHKPYVSDPKVKSFIQWTKTLKDNVIQRRTAVGGQFCYPPPPPMYTHTSSTTAGQASSLSLTAVADLQGELEGLQYREHRTLAVQGHITAVRYHQWPPEAPKSATRQTPPHVTQHSESASVGVASSGNRGRMRKGERDVAPPPTLPKRRRTERELKQARLEDEEESDERPLSEVGAEHSPQTTDSSETEGSPGPAASWQSRAWPALEREVTSRVRCGALDRESVAEKFRYDEQHVLLHKINLSPSGWSPELPSHTHSLTHTPVDCRGYLTLTLLGLNQQAAVDFLFLPMFSSADPRAVGKTHGSHDNTLMSCLTSGFAFDPTSGTCSSPEALLSSAAALEDERVVCVLDVCLLGPDRVEIVCSKLYRTADVSPV